MGEPAWAAASARCRMAVPIPALLCPRGWRDTQIEGSWGPASGGWVHPLPPPHLHSLHPAPAGLSRIRCNFRRKSTATNTRSSRLRRGDGEGGWVTRACKDGREAPSPSTRATSPRHPHRPPLPWPLSRPRGTPALPPATTCLCSQSVSEPEPFPDPQGVPDEGSPRVCMEGGSGEGRACTPGQRPKGGGGRRRRSPRPEPLDPRTAGPVPAWLLMTELPGLERPQEKMSDGSHCPSPSSAPPHGCPCHLHNPGTSSLITKCRGCPTGAPTAALAPS